MKKPIYIGVSITLLIILLWTGFISLVVNYNPVQEHIKDLLSNNAIKETSVGKIEISKFPLPKIILNDIAISDNVHIAKVTISLNFLSILKAKPEISNISASNKDYDLNIKMHYLNGKPTYGKAKANLTNITALLNNYPDLKTAAENFISPESTMITFDIVHSDEYLSFANMKLSSPRITATGDVWFALKPGSPNKVKIECDKLTIFSDELQKISAIVAFDDNILTLETFSGTIGSGGNINISGDITGSSYRSMFKGHIDANHNDLNLLLNNLSLQNCTSSAAAASSLSSDIKITPIEISLYNLTSKISDLEIKGEAAIKFIGNTPRTVADITLTGFDSNKQMPFITPLYLYLSSLKDKMQDQAYVTKFIPLRSIQSLGSFNATLIKPIFGEHNADLIKFSGNISPGNLIIDSLQYESGNNNFSGNASLTTTIVKPKLRIDITSGDIQTDLLTLDNLLALNQELANNYDITKASIDFTANLNSITQNGTKYDKVNLKFSNDNATILLPSLSFQKDTSRFIANGNLVIAPSMQINLAYAYNLMDIKSAMDYFISGLGVSGIVSSNGVLYTHGDTIAALLYNLYIKSDFIAENMQINGYQIDDFIDQINTLTYNANNLAQDAENKTQTGITKLSKISGSYTMNLGRIALDKMQFSTQKSTGTLAGSYNIYKEDLDLESTINFPLTLTSNYNSKSNFGMIIKYHDDLFEKFVDLKQLISDLNKRVRNIPFNTPRM
jgi:hypothetical protein